MDRAGRCPKVINQHDSNSSTLSTQYRSAQHRATHSRGVCHCAQLEHVSFARFDIWAQRRLSDEVLLNDRAWQRDFRLWETADGLLAGAVFFESDRDAVLIGHPDWPDLIEPMLAYAEARYVEKGSAEPLMIEAMESNVARV